jgi:starch-binding outer membrane protein, SusD/RagB family
MKKTTYLLILLTLTLGSCTKILEVQPAQAVSADEAIKDKTGVDRAITGSYNALQFNGSYGRNQIIIEDLAADNLNWTGTTQDYSQIANNLISADNGIIDGIWSANYDCINRVNNVLARMPGIADMTLEDRNMYTGDGLFLRALCHFNLVNFFGGVPIKTQPTLDLTNVDQARNTVPEVYAQIVGDLLAAQQLLPAIRSIGKASAFSAKALLARVYLTEYHLNNDPGLAAAAIAAADTVINEGGFILADSCADLYNGNTSESIFEIIYDAQNSNRLAQYFFPRSLTGRYEVSPTTQLIQSYEVADSNRFKASIAYDSINLPYGIKYKDIKAGTDRVYVLRLAEMYLIRAEANAYSNGSIEAIRSDIDIIRKRAGLPATEATDYPGLKLAIENERRHEFAFESQRWSDLVRTKRATTVLGIPENYTLFPIPLSEMLTNKKISQNPGY